MRTHYLGSFWDLGTCLVIAQHNFRENRLFRPCMTSGGQTVGLTWKLFTSGTFRIERAVEFFSAFLALLHLFTANLGGSARNSEIVQFQLFGNSAFIYSIGARYSLYCCLLWRSESINNTSASVSTHTVTEYECTASIIGCNVSEYYALPWHSTYNRHIFMQKY